MSNCRLSRAAVLCAGAVSLAVLAGCGRPPLETYERTCSQDTDCVVVVVPNCGPCAGCGDAAISAHEQERFDSEQAVFCVWREHAECGACMPHEAICEAGQCLVVITDDNGDIIERIPPPGE